ncbi:4Fe-4S binding protein [Streptomyces marispadix]|uniref:4Fe-4S binding protein n=1 Tax=Streptomyces marispadix TaxID=2922868 RepID=A0ABS9STU6_9ACTN|nr:4Fe-4S binding protein [Streptomyces marispadix]MCH6159598.1 4Fe-4S binding protein [Streptomyces marispadix]
MSVGDRPGAGSATAAGGGTATAVPSCAAPSQIPDAVAPFHVSGRCAGCGACLLTCPQRAIRPSGGTLLIRADLCDGCGECVEVCPVDAIDEVAVPGRNPGPAPGGCPGPAAPGGDPDPGSPRGGLR